MTETDAEDMGYVADTSRPDAYDILGTLLHVGDKVATDVTYHRSSRLRVGTLTAYDGKHVTVSYEIEAPSWRKDQKPRKQSVTRSPEGVVKVSAA